MTQLRILLIESDAGMLDHLQHSLGGRGFEVNVVPDGLIGLAELERRPTLPDLILLRVEIPRMSGYTVCNKIKRREKLRGIPLILLASQATPETFAQHKRLRTRADGYLSIPFDDGELLGLIDNLTHGKALSGSFVSVPAVSEDAFQGMETGGTRSDMQALGPSNYSSPSHHAHDEYQLIEEIDEHDPMILSVEDLTDDHTPLRNAAGPHDLGSDSLEALINEEQELSAQQLRDLWSASLEDVEENTGDFDRTIVGQIPPVSEEDDDEDHTVVGIHKKQSAPASATEESAPTSETRSPRRMTPPSAASLPSSPFEPKRTATPDSEEPSGSPRRLRTPTPSGGTRSRDNLPATQGLSSSSSRDDAPSEPDLPANHDAGEDDAIADMLDAHFKDMLDEGEVDKDTQALQEAVQKLEAELEALHQAKEQQEAEFAQQRELWLQHASEGGNDDAAFQMQLAEAQAQLDANQEERKDLYEEITKLRRTVSELKAAEEAAALSNVESIERDELNALREQLGDYERSLRKTEESNERLKEELDAIQQDLEASQQHSDAESVQLNQIQREYEALQHLYNESEQKVEQHDLIVEEMRAQIKDRDADARELRSELAALRVHIQGQMSSDDELLNQMSDKEKELQLLREDINQLGESYDQLEQQYQSTLVERDRFREELDTRNKALLHLSTGQDELKIAQSRLSEESQKKTERINSLNERVETLEGELEAYQGDLSTTAEERNKYRDEVMDLNNELDAARAEVRNLQDSELQLRDRLSDVERQREQLQHELEDAQSKVNRLSGSIEELELEVVQLRKQNVELEQFQFEADEKFQRSEQMRTEAESNFDAEKKGRLDLLNKNDLLQTELAQLKADHEKVVGQRDELYAELDSVRSYLEEETSRREELEHAQVNSLQSLATVETELSSRAEQYEQEILNLQTDYEREMAAREQELQEEAATREAHLVADLQDKAEQDRSELLLRLDKRRMDELEQQKAEFDAEFRELNENQQAQLAVLLREHTEELNHIRQESQLELEQRQSDSQREHAQAIDQLEEELRRLRQQMRGQEEEFREQLSMQREEARLDLERQLQEQEQQVTLHNQSVVDDYEQREAELERQLRISNRSRDELQERVERAEHGQASQKEEFLRLKGRLSDLESLREHERIQLQHLEQEYEDRISAAERERDERILQLEDQIHKLEKSIQKGISDSAQLYQKLKRHEMRKESTVKALQDALSLLNKEDEERASHRDTGGFSANVDSHRDTGSHSASDLRSDSHRDPLRDSSSGAFGSSESRRDILAESRQRAESRRERIRTSSRTDLRASRTPTPRSTPAAAPRTPTPSSTPRADARRENEDANEKPQFANLESFARKLDF